MELVLLCTSAIIIANYVKKRSLVIAVGHSILFVFLLILSLFKTDISWIQNAMQNACGERQYHIMRAAMNTPYSWFFSTNIVISIVEFVCLLIAAVLAAIFVVDKVRGDRAPIPADVAQKNEIILSPVCVFAYDRNLFLRYCKLLN